jgi:hypothetical protein
VRRSEYLLLYGVIVQSVEKQEAAALSAAKVKEEKAAAKEERAAKAKEERAAAKTSNKRSDKGVDETTRPQKRGVMFLVHSRSIVAGAQDDGEEEGKVKRAKNDTETVRLCCLMMSHLAEGV